MSQKIYLFRHTESIDNANLVFSGRRDFGLSETGIRNAHLLKEELKDVKFEVAYTSPLKRCKDSINIVLDEYHPETNLIEDSRLVERSYGMFHGKRKLNLPFHLWVLKLLTYRSYLIPPPGGESFKDVWKRVTPFVHDLEESMKQHDGNVLICSHHNSMRPLIAHYENRSVLSLLTDRSQNRDVKIYSF